jgi:RHS repeat-associated protein
VLDESNPSVSFRYGYTGRERDLESGLSYYRARYYDSNVGRFISTDPIGFEAGDTNLYRYVFNSSTNYTDPSGKILPLLAAFWVGGLAAAGTAALIGGITGAAKSLANAYDNGEQLSLGVIGNALGEGIKGAVIGGAMGFAIGGAIAATAVASPFLAAAAGVGLAASGLYGNASSAVENFQAGRYASAGVDLVSALFDVKGVRDSVAHSVSAYKSAAESGKWYNKSSEWKGVAHDYVNQQRDNTSSDLMWKLMTLSKEQTIGYKYGDTMLGGGINGMGPGAAFSGEFSRGNKFHPESILNYADYLGRVDGFDWSGSDFSPQTRQNVELAIQLREEFNTTTPYGSKTRGMGEDRTRVESGWGRKDPPLQQGTNNAFELAREIGYTFPTHEKYDRGVPGRFYASHAEPQMAGLNRNQTVFVQSNSGGMCEACPSFFKALATFTTQERIVIDPTGIYIFKTNGEIKYFTRE